MNLLVIGSGGMLGHMVTLYLRSVGYSVADVSKTRKINDATILMDVMDESSVSRLLSRDFDAVINCAAMLVGSSETNRDAAVRINSWFPHLLETLLYDTKTRIIQVSSDGIFSGNNAPYAEYALCDSSTFYGKTKWLGELQNKKDLTVRGSFVGPDLSKNGTGLFNWFVQQQGHVTGYNSVCFNAVTTLEFAKFVDFALQNDVSGIYHLGACETISKANFLHRISKTFALNNITITDNDTIKTDNTLLNSRNDVVYVRKNYDEMLAEIKSFMLANGFRYKHYSFL